MQNAKKMESELFRERLGVIPNEITIEFVDERNNASFKEKVLNWLRADFEKRRRPNNHFWHNRDAIARAFDSSQALVALTNRGECVGYMIWDIYAEIGAEIDIIEVKETYRQQGIFKKMLENFCEKFTDICVLSGSVLPQSEEIFEKVGWKKIGKKHIKIIKPCLSSLDALPEGQAIAVCSKDFYAVKAKPDEYSHLMKYFEIKMTPDGKLDKPLVTAHHYEGYIGIYLNKKLIAEGKAKHLFKDGYASSFELLVLNKIMPVKPELFQEFFSVAQREIIAEGSTSGQKRLNESASIEQAKPNKKQADSLLFSPTALEIFDVSRTPEILPVSREYRGKRLAGGSNNFIPDN